MQFSEWCPEPRRKGGLMRNRNVAADPQRKAEALQLAAEYGAAEASRRTGIPSGTIRAWRTRAGQSEPPVGDRGEDWRAGRERTAHGAAQVAREAIEQARRDIRDGKPLRAQQSMTAAGIAVDKLTIIENQLAAYEERQMRLVDGQAQVVAALFPIALAAAGVPVGPFRPVLGDLLRRASEGGPLVVSPAIAQPAYAAVRGYFERILRDELGEERRQLPAGPEEVQVREADVVVEPDGESPAEEETAEAEVVVEKSIEEQAREMTARIVAKMQADQVEREEFGVGRLEPRAGGFDVPRGLG